MEAEAKNGVNDNIIFLSQGPVFSNALGRKECNVKGLQLLHQTMV